LWKFKSTIKKRSRVPGVMITQYVKELPRGKTTPDFTRKPIALTVQEGRVAIFKAVVNGDPAPTVTWARNKGDTSDPEKYKPRYDERTREHVLEIVNVQVDQADTYKCFATNLFGKAMCTAALSVFAVGFKKKSKDTSKKGGYKRKEKPKKEGEIDPKFWEVMLSAKKSDYERICHEFGVTDYRWMLKQLNLKKKEKEDEQAKVVENVGNMNQIEVKTSGRAEFEFDMKLKDANSQINLYKNGEMLDYGDGTDDSSKHNMKKTGDKYMFSINNLGLNDGGLYQVDVEDVNIISTTLAIPDVEFDGMLKDAKVVEGQDAMFEGIFSGPVPQITWCANDISVEHGDKYNITVSEDKLTHRLVVKNCKKEDKGVYTAIAGIKSSRATLAVDEKKTKQPGEARVQMGEVMELMAMVVQRMVVVMERMAIEDLAEMEEKDVEEMQQGSMDKVALEQVIIIHSHVSVPDDKVHFASGLTDKNALRGKPAELVCKLNTDKMDGVWYKDGNKMTSKDGVVISKDGCTHKLIIQNCKDSDGGLYHFEVNGCKTEAMVRVGDLPEFDPDGLQKFSNPVIVKAGQSASFKMSFPPQASLEIKWFKNGLELLDGGSVKVVKESNHSRLQIKDCLRSDTGQIKIQLKNPFGSIEALSSLIVLDKPGPPQGPLEVNESTSSVLELKWNPPKDDGEIKLSSNIFTDFEQSFSVKPHFKDPEDFMVVRSGNSIRIKINYEASPPPDITWLKNGEPVSPWNKIIHADGTCTLVIPSSKYSDSGVYTIVAKNSSGQASFDIEVRVTDEPKPPGPVVLEQVVYGKVIITWSPSPDHNKDDRLHYVVEEYNSNTRIWRRIADHLLCTTYTTNIQPGQEYHFRVYAKNDMGLSDPSESPTWGINNNKVPMPSTVSAVVTLERPPSILVPLKRHTPPKGYQCYMTCAVRGCPSPYIAWYHNGICINSDNNYYITNTSGVCSMYILRVRPEDSGEYKVVAVNQFGKAECSSILKVKGMTAAVFISMLEKCLPQSPDLHDGLSFVNSHVANNFQHGYVMQMGNSYARACQKVTCRANMDRQSFLCGHRLI
uniref:Immunoglobulin like and fibronectin type III domain containing 1, tandem duplicate 4 n=1 Tax=Sinocyclocheilus grahami TaxID=75366 RepID=A0A672R9V9_SINGR